jgi:hypothetical protein
MDGISMKYTWDKANAEAPSKRTTQYFEMLGNRAIYHVGWVACTTPVSTPWDLGIKPSPDVISGYKWELYHVDEDFSQSTDLAAKMPDKLKELQDLFYKEAKKNDVLPLDNSSVERFLTPRPSPTAGRTNFTYSGESSGVPPACAPSIFGRSYNIKAEVDIPKGGAEGMIVTEDDELARPMPIPHCPAPPEICRYASPLSTWHDIRIPAQRAGGWAFRKCFARTRGRRMKQSCATFGFPGPRQWGRGFCHWNGRQQRDRKQCRHPPRHKHPCKLQRKRRCKHRPARQF